jgi:non-specific serine/threonine protein kinase
MGPGRSTTTGQRLPSRTTARAIGSRLTDARSCDELRSELAQAEEWNDPERASAVRAELDFLKAELASAVGLGGRDRRAASATERARISVTRAIRGALDRIRAQSPLLGRHLDATIRTGAYCSYTPDPRVPIQWEL